MSLLLSLFLLRKLRLQRSEITVAAFASCFHIIVRGSSSHAKVFLALLLSQKPPPIFFLSVDYAFERLMSSCCSKKFKGLSLEAHKVLMKDRDGRETTVGIG